MPVVGKILPLVGKILALVGKILLLVNKMLLLVGQILPLVSKILALVRKILFLIGNSAFFASKKHKMARVVGILLFLCCFLRIFVLVFCFSQSVFKGLSEVLLFGAGVYFRGASSIDHTTRCAVKWGRQRSTYSF